MHLSFTIFLFFLVDLHVNDALRAHDCSTPEVSTMYNIAELGECTASEPDSVTELEKRQLSVLAKDKYRIIKVIQCYVAVKATIFHCGRTTNTDILAEDRPNYLKITADECRTMATSGVLKLPRGKTLAPIPKKGIHTKVDMVGFRDNKGRCGQNYDFKYNGQDYTGNMIWKIQAYWDIVDLAIDRATDVILGSYTVCQPFIQECRDGKWLFIPYRPRQTEAEACEYSLTRTKEFRIFEADAANHTSKKDIMMLKNNLVISADPNVALRFTIIGQISACSQILYVTNYEGVVLTESKNAQYFKKVVPPNIDHTMHMDQKIYAVNGFTQDEVKKIYKNVREQACKTRKMTWQNRFQFLGTVQPGRPGMISMNPPILGVIAGELLYLLKCKTIKVTLRETKACYVDIPVLQGKKPMCLEPVTRLLKPTCRTIPCNKIIRSAFRDDDGRWVEYHKSYNHISPPKEFVLNMTWYRPEFFKLRTLKHGGLYNRRDVQRFTEYLYRRDRTEEIMTKLAQQTDLLDDGEMVIDRDLIGLTRSHFSGFFGSIAAWLRNFGTYVSSFFGIYVIFLVIKYVFNRLVDFQVFRHILKPIRVLMILLCPPLGRRYTILKAHWSKRKAAQCKDNAPNDDPDADDTATGRQDGLKGVRCDIEPRYDAVNLIYSKPQKNLCTLTTSTTTGRQDHHIFPIMPLIPRKVAPMPYTFKRANNN